MTRAAGAVQPQRARQLLALNLENQQPAEGDPRPRLLSVLVLSHLLPAFGAGQCVGMLACCAGSSCESCPDAHPAIQLPFLAVCHMSPWDMGPGSPLCNRMTCIGTSALACKARLSLGVVLSLFRSW